jgi:hypothetical protein
MSPNAEGMGKGGLRGVSANEYSCAHGAQINFGDLTPCLTYETIIVLKRAAGPVAETVPDWEDDQPEG